MSDLQEAAKISHTTCTGRPALAPTFAHSIAGRRGSAFPGSGTMWERDFANERELPPLMDVSDQVMCMVIAKPADLNLITSSVCFCN